VLKFEALKVECAQDQVLPNANRMYSLKPPPFGDASHRAPMLMQDLFGRNSGTQHCNLGFNWVVKPYFVRCVPSHVQTRLRLT